MRFNSSDSRFLRPSLMLGVSMAALLSSAPAYAQTPPEEAPPAPEEVVAEEAQADPAPQEGQPEPGTIVVTGSRIRGRPEFTSPDPVTLIDPAVARREGKFDTAETLQSSPIAAGSTQITAAISSNFVTQGGQGTQTIDLRGLGPNRTLVLLNGRRAGPAGTRGAVAAFDLNVLPQSIIQRVDVLKTGASSIYGSDAVAGVVNIFTKRDTDGLQLDMNVSIPEKSGGAQYRVSAIYGKEFERGHFMIAADYHRQKELTRGDRDYLGCPEAYIFREDGSRADLIDPRSNSFHCEDTTWGHVWAYDLEYRALGEGFGNLRLPDGRYSIIDSRDVALLQFNYPGALAIPDGFIPPAVFLPGAFSTFIAPPGWFPTGYDAPSSAVQNSFHPFVLQSSLIPDTKRYTLYAEGSYDITDNIEAFAEFLANRRKTYQNSYRQIWSFGITGDLFNTGDIYDTGTIWADGWEGLNTLSPTAITDHFDSSQKVDYWRGVGGLRGDFGGFLKGWSWETYVQYSHSKGRYRQEQFLQEIYDVASFQSVSCVGTTLPISGKQCIDLPWTDPFFLAGDFTPEQADFMFDWEEGRTLYKQLTAEASMTGTLFELPAGPVGVALGIQYRRDDIHDKPGEITLAGNAWGFSVSGITAGDQVTKEAFGEISLPILANEPLFKDFSVSGAARVTSVKAQRDSDDLSDSDSGNWTYKLGLNWAVNDWLRFRGTWGTSYRSPALFEQFLADETGFFPQRGLDPCIGWDDPDTPAIIAQNCAADGLPPGFGGASITAEVASSGGIGFLEAETSLAKTFSVILTPRFGFLPDTRVSLAVDYFDIKVNGEISQLGPANILLGCYSSQTFPDDPLCDLFTRNPEGSNDEFAVATVTDPFINIASQRNKGLDFTLDVRHNFGRMGSLNILASVTRQLKDDIVLLPGSPKESDNGEAGSPKWAGEVNFTWQSADKDWTAFWGIDWISKTSNVRDFLEANADDPCLESFHFISEEPIYGRYCPDLKTPSVFFHNVSVSKTFGSQDQLEITAGVANLFDKHPPRVSVFNGGQISMIGPVVAASQYDSGLLGRRYFLNVSKRF